MPSSIDRSFPAPDAKMSSQQMRDQFGAAADDIEALQSAQATLQAAEGHVSRITVTADYTVSDSPTSKLVYVGVRPSGTPITVSLSGIAQSTDNIGRLISVVDESGNASGVNINVTGGVALINGDSDPYVINTNYGGVTLVMDGTNWFVLP